jgi:AhpD family alkylhydroperoxidase
MAPFEGPNILNVHSLRPAALRHHLDLYMGLLFGPGGLSRGQRELVAVAVSQANHCAYRVAHHAEALGEAGLADDDILLVSLIVAYFNFVNRIALGLGVACSEAEVEGYKV